MKLQKELKCKISVGVISDILIHKKRSVPKIAPRIIIKTIKLDRVSTALI